MKELTDKQYLLLNAYYDGETNRRQAWQAERLVKKNVLAYEYLDSLEGLTANLQREKEALMNSNKELPSWEALASRINQEERNALYLGERKIQPGSSNFISEFLNNVFPNNLSKAFATACLAFVLGVVYKYSAVEIKTNSSLVAKASQEINNLPVVASVNTPAQIVPVSNRNMQLDWVKSDGRIRLIPTDEVGEQRIIWVMTPRKAIVGK